MEHFYKTIPGMMDYEDLYSAMVERFNSGTFVELGTWRGRSSAFMCIEILNSKKDINFFSIDNFLKCDDRAKDLQKDFDFYKVIESDTSDASRYFKDGSVDFVFVDADHSYNGVQYDIKAWLPKLKKNGVMAGHDYHNPRYPDLSKGVDELLNVKPISKMCWIYGG